MIKILRSGKYQTYKKTPRKFLGIFVRFVVSWNSTSTEPIDSSFDGLCLRCCPCPKRSIAPNHKSFYLDRLFASTISKGSVKDCGLNYSKVATLIWTTQLVLAVLVFYWNADSDPHLYNTGIIFVCQGVDWKKFLN